MPALIDAVAVLAGLVMIMVAVGGLAYVVGRSRVHRRFRSMRDCHDPLCRAGAAQHAATDMIHVLQAALAWSLGLGLVAGGAALIGLPWWVCSLVAAPVAIIVSNVFERWTTRRDAARGIDRRRHAQHP